jgi:hypothetical protein
VIVARLNPPETFPTKLSIKQALLWQLSKGLLLGQQPDEQRVAGKRQIDAAGY